jgi:hypothetical protein
MQGLSQYFDRSRAYLVGIEEYAVGKLNTPVNDVRLIAGTLLKHEFSEADIVIKENIDKAGFEELIAEMKRDITANERVLFYFAGHGVAFESDYPKGYLLPVNAQLNDKTNYISLDWLMKELNDVNCRHLLLVLDCCFAGTVRWSENYRAVRFDNVKKLYREKFERFVNDVSWQVLTSSSYDERAIDSLLPIGDRDATATSNSPFAAIFADILDNDRDDFPDGVITTTRLYDLLEQRLETYLRQNKPGHRQSPNYFLLNKHRKGQFVFLHPRKWQMAIAALPDRGAQNPYKGLFSYRDSDKHLFFGRDNAIRELSELVVKTKLKVVVVTGASGIGKTSLLEAGVKPAVRYFFPNFISYRPSQVNSDPQIVEKIREKASQLKKFILLIDQYEELETVCSEVQRKQWVKLLKELKAVHPGVLIIASVRIDFEVQLKNVLANVFHLHERYVVAPLERPELEAVIMQPAWQAAIKIVAKDDNDASNDAFVNKIIDEAMQSTGSLPLLSYALQAWYIKSAKETGGGWIMSEHTYLQVGGVSGALAKIMERFLLQLSSGDQVLLRDLLIRMVSVTDNAYTRKKIFEDEIEYTDKDKRKRALALIKSMEAYRIITTNTYDPSRANDRIYYEPAHDSVISSWTTLVKWINEERERIRVFQRLAESAGRWHGLAVQRNHILWRPGTDLDTVLKDVNPNRKRNLKTIIADNIRGIFTWGKLPQIESEPHSFLNKKESSFLRASVLRIRRIRHAVTSGVFVLLVVAVWTAVVMYNNRQANEALFINATSESSSPSEKLLLLQRAYELDPNQEVTKENIVRLMNLSPSYYSPFATDIIYHRGNNARSIELNDKTGQYLTTADSSVVWWNAKLDHKKMYKDSTVIAAAGFMTGRRNRMFYLTFTGLLRIYNEDNELVNKATLGPRGEYTRAFGERNVLHAAYCDTLDKLVLVSTTRSNQPDDSGNQIMVSILNDDGRVVRHDTLPDNPISSFLVMMNKHSNELYFYDSRWLLTYDLRKRRFNQYQLWKEPDYTGGAINLERYPAANDFPVFKFSQDGKSFFYKPFKDSCFLLTLGPQGHIIKKKDPWIRDAAFIGASRSLLAISENGVQVIENENNAGMANVGKNLVSINAFGNGNHFLIDDADGDVYLLNEHLSLQLLIDKSYNAERATISNDRSRLLVTSRTGAFYTFDLSRKNYLFRAGAYAQILPLPSRSAFATWSSEDKFVQIVEADGRSYYFEGDTTVTNVLASRTNDSLFVFTLKSYYIVNNKGDAVLQKPPPLADLEDDIIPQGDTTFLVTHDSIIRRFTYDLKRSYTLNFANAVNDVFADDNGNFVVLTDSGEVALYTPSFKRRWSFRDRRLAKRYFGDEVIYRPPMVYKLTGGDYTCFDTLGRFQGSGTLARNTSLPGGNYTSDKKMNIYLFSPPYIPYSGVQNVIYEHILYDISGRQLFNYRFDQVVTGQVMDEDRLLFQSGNYEVFAQFTPQGAMKQFRKLKLRLVDAHQ